MAVDFGAQINQRFTPGSAQNQAATTAYQNVLAKGGNLDAGNVGAWLDYLKDHGGVVHELPAARILRAFLQLPTALPIVSDEPPLSAGAPGALMRRVGKTEKPWTEKILDRDVPARIAAFEADLRWLNSLDVGDSKQYQDFARWAGWAQSAWPKDGQTSSMQTDGTIHHWLGSGLARRHGLSKEQREAVVTIFSGPPAERNAKLESLLEDLGPAVGKTAERTAVFSAFFNSMIDTRERILDRATTEAEQRALLEQKMGLAPGTISERDFKDLLEVVSPSWRRSEDPSAYLQHARRYPTVTHFENAYVIEQGRQA